MLTLKYNTAHNEFMKYCRLSKINVCSREVVYIAYKGRLGRQFGVTANHKDNQSKPICNYNNSNSSYVMSSKKRVTKYKI